jgi:hypothetical protein
MDRDQVNCLHYLYQGRIPGHRGPIPGIPVDWPSELRQLLFWCPYDTLSPLTNDKLVEEHQGALVLPPWCLSFVDEVEKQLRNMPNPNFVFGYPLSAQIREPGERRPAFVAIPYRRQFDEVKAAIQEAAQAANFHCEVTGDLAKPGTIMDQVWQGIRGADVVIADITGHNPNVMYEVGLAAALGKEVIITTQRQNLPFDIRHWRTIRYKPDRLDLLKDDLEAGFRAVSARYPHEGPEPRF